MDQPIPPILLAQCKAFHSPEDVSKEIACLLKAESVKDFSIHISLPYSYIDPIKQQFGAEGIHVGAEIALGLDEGGFTKSIAGRMIKEANAEFVLIGASQDLALTQNPVSLKNKLKDALEHKITPFVCISETLQQHQDKISKKILCDQLKEITEGVNSVDLASIFIVYNAEWISRTPWEAKSPELAEAYQTFREAVSEVFGAETISPKQLIVAVPGYSHDVPQLIESLKNGEHPINNFSIGILGDSAEYLQPLCEVKKTQADEGLHTMKNTTKEENKENENV